MFGEINNSFQILFSNKKKPMIEEINSRLLTMKKILLSINTLLSKER